MRGKLESVCEGLVSSLQGMSTALKIFLVAVVLLVLSVILLGVFDVRLSSASDMLAQLTKNAFGNLTDVLSTASH